jgi:hypothetical protein
LGSSWLPVEKLSPEITMNKTLSLIDLTFLLKRVEQDQTLPQMKISATLKGRNVRAEYAQRMRAA